MKRTMPWNDDDSDSSSDESSSGDTDASDNDQILKKNKKISSGGSSKTKVESTKRKSKGIDFEALSQHGYKGGLSVLKVPPPKEDDRNRDWSWSNGKESRGANETEESYQERQKTRAMLLEGEQLVNVQTQKERNLSFSQKEKRKRDIGQASRGKSYVPFLQSQRYQSTIISVSTPIIGVPSALPLYIYFLEFCYKKSNCR